ncbi:MAG: serine/threonine-protein phosphatase [Phycisphaerales bacterium]|nr:serine/threonine-protein phosphatase [Phycisphaerales bacterium]
MVAPSPPRILVVSDSVPSEALGGGGLGPLLARDDYRFIFADMAAASEKIANHDLAAAIVLAPPPYFNGHQKDLIHVIDGLVQRQIGAIVLAHQDADMAMAERMCRADGLMAVPVTCSADELAGRLAGLAAARPIVDQLQRENHLLRQFDSGLNSRMSQMDEEMRLAARLQVDFLPRNLPEVGKVSFNVFFRPASYVSGDIYDVTRLDEDHVGFFVADAVGHGMPAALLTIFLKRALQTKIVTRDEYRLVLPNEALTHLNKELVSQQLSMCQFVTMVYGMLNIKTLELQWARAGHPPPMKLSTNGTVEELQLEGALLGVFPDEVFALQTLQMKPGDSILMYSDGFESAFPDVTGGGAGEINERYYQEFRKLAGPNPKARFAAMTAELDNQEGSLHQRDDLTAVMLSIAE